MQANHNYCMRWLREALDSLPRATGPRGAPPPRPVHFAKHFLAKGVVSHEAPAPAGHMVTDATHSFEPLPDPKEVFEEDSWIGSGPQFPSRLQLLGRLFHLPRQGDRACHARQRVNRELAVFRRSHQHALCVLLQVVAPYLIADEGGNLSFLALICCKLAELGSALGRAGAAWAVSPQRQFEQG